MKVKHIIGCLMLAGACLSCSSDKEDELILLTDKGVDIDDEKTHSTPADENGPFNPGDTEGKPIIGDSIPFAGDEETPPIAGWNTLYIADNQVDSALFDGESEIIESHIVVQTGGHLQITKNHTMHDDATITIESGGGMSVYANIRHVDLTIKSGGTLRVGHQGTVFLRNDLHLEENVTISIEGGIICDEDLNPHLPSIDESLSGKENTDSLDMHS